MGGVGKSAFVKQYARNYCEKYVSGIYWISADTLETIETSFRYIAT